VQRSELHLRDVYRVPCLLSLARAPLAVAFPLVHHRAWAFAILLVAGATDVLDGWYARRFGQVSAAGAVLDPITDKLFVGSVALTLIGEGRLDLVTVALLATREIGEAPLVAWLAWSHRTRRARTENPTANVPGKIATTLQFACVTCALFDARHVVVLASAIATACAGALAAALYWRRFARARN
jgi:cardiolipin synthase (CMP-forming)